MRVALVGQKWLGAETLRLLLDRGHKIASVAAPDGDRLAEAAREEGLPVWTGLLNDPALWHGCDVAVAAHAHAFIPGRMLDTPRHGCVAYHPSLLPRHRGRDAVRWTIYMGDRVAGGTVYRMTEEVDAGPVLAQDWCHVRPDDTASTLWRRELGPMGLRLFTRVLYDRYALLRHVEGAREQDESLATWEPAFDRPPLRESAG